MAKHTNYNPNSQNNESLFNGIKLLKEQNFSTSNTDVPLWQDDLPLKEGDTFPARDMQRRANINKTMDALISGDLADTLQNFIYTWPDLDPTTNRKVSRIVASLPLFTTVVNTWELLLHHCIAGVQVRGEENHALWKLLNDKIDDIIINKFCACDRLVVSYANDTEAVTKIYSDKNIYLTRNDKDELILSLTNIYTDEDNKSYLEVITFLDDGCLRNVFEYGSSRVGRRVVINEHVDSRASAHFEKNGNTRTTYGQPLIGGLLPSVLGAVRAFSLVTLLTEKKREVIRVVPESQIQVDEFTGASAYVGGGTVAYNENNPDTSEHNHDVTFVTPSLAINEALDILEKMLRQVSMYSGLSGVILGYQEISGNLAARAIAQSSLSTIINATGYIDELTKELKLIAANTLRIAGDTEITEDDITIVTIAPARILATLIGDDNEQ